MRGVIKGLVISQINRLLCPCCHAIIDNHSNEIPETLYEDTLHTDGSGASEIDENP